MTEATTLVQPVGEGKVMTGEQIDEVGIDWRKENLGKE